MFVRRVDSQGSRNFGQLQSITKRKASPFRVSEKDHGASDCSVTKEAAMRMNTAFVLIKRASTYAGRLFYFLVA